jgi:hypothetical protein
MKDRGAGLGEGPVGRPELGVAGRLQPDLADREDGLGIGADGAGEQLEGQVELLVDRQSGGRDLGQLGRQCPDRLILGALQDVEAELVLRLEVGVEGAAG